MYTKQKLRAIFKNTILLFLLVVSSHIWSQHSISGEIKDQSNVPVAYANILLLKAQDSSVVTGTSSDDFGKFSFSNINAGAYILKSSFIGYKSDIRNFEVSGDLSLDTIILEEDVEALGEVELTYVKPTLKREVDRLVFNVQNTALSEGNMMEVLRSTPSVLVFDDGIRVKNMSPSVYINDRKVHLSSSDLVSLLEGTTASTIKSVEVITNPSAKYDAESGIVLNIVMAKNLITGYNGSIHTNFSQGVFPRNSHGTSHFFKNKKLDLFLNYNYTDQKIDRENREIVNYPNEKWDTSLDRNTWSETHNFGFNIDYNISKKSSLAFAANLQFLPYFKYLTSGKTTITPKLTIGQFNTHNLSRDKKYNLGFDIDYIYNFQGQSKLKFNSHYTTYDYYRNQNVNSNYFDQNDFFLLNTQYKTRSDQNTGIFTSQVDYTLPTTERSKLELGVKYVAINTESGIIHRDLISGQEIVNPTNTNDFDYEENVTAGYLNYESRGDKTSLSIGVRVENTAVEGLSSSNQVNKQDYTQWFPSIVFGHQISDQTYSFINYNRTIERPNYRYLNPFKFYLSDNFLVTGNPELKPVLFEQYSIGTTFNNILTIEAHYRKYQDKIEEFPLQDNLTNIVSYTPINLNSSSEIGFDIDANFTIGEYWNVYIGSSTYHIKDEVIISGSQAKKNKWSNYSTLQNDFSLLKDRSLSVGLYITRAGANIQGLQEVGTTWYSNLSISKTVFNKKGVVSLSMNDLLNKQDFIVTSNFLDQNSSLYSNLDNRYIKLGFRYKFGNTNLSNNQRLLDKEERDRLSEDEEND